MCPGTDLNYPIEQQPLSEILRDLPVKHSDGTFPTNSILPFGYQGVKPRLAADDENFCWENKASATAPVSNNRLSEFLRTFPTVIELSTVRLKTGSVVKSGPYFE
jgi:hypothetical protein